MAAEGRPAPIPEIMHPLVAKGEEMAFLRQLTDLGLDVVAIDRNPNARGAKAAAQLGVPFVVGDAALEETLRAASIETAKALVVVSTDDVTNLQSALNARSVRSDIRVVLRLFDDDFARRVQKAFNINISRSVSRMVAPRRCATSARGGNG